MGKGTREGVPDDDDNIDVCVCVTRNAVMPYRTIADYRVLFLQRFATRRCYSTCSLHGIQHVRHNSCEQTYI